MNEFRLDLRSIDLLGLKKLGILSQDVKNILALANSEHHVFPEFLYVIGYIEKVKFLHIAYRISKNVNFDIEILQVDIPNEEEITRYWCRRKCES